MKRRNPLLAGLFNVLVPGSSHLYVMNDWRKFILFFVLNVFIIFIVVLLGINIQNYRAYTLPQGVCVGILLFGVFAFLFYRGIKMASERNSETDSAAHYQSLRANMSKDDDPIAKLARLQKQADAKKADVDSNKK